jgi:DNA-binding NtrC family response regulator
MEDPLNTFGPLHHQPSTFGVSNRLAAQAGGFQKVDVVQAARTSSCVLFTGLPNPEGIAFRIHSLSGWRLGPFVSVDCGASGQTLERQLFDVLSAGEEWNRVAEPRPQLAQQGTIFLCEVGKLSLALQTRLSEALDSRRPGEIKRRLRRRVMASTSVSLLDRVQGGTFDECLFYRLNAIHVTGGGEGKWAAI